MNKKELIREVARRTGLSSQTSSIILNCIVENICQALEYEDKVIIRNFGAFYKLVKQGKRYYDISTGKIKESKTKKFVKFVPYKGLKEHLKRAVLDVSKENDGSIGNSIMVEQYVYINPQYQPLQKTTSTTNGQLKLGHKNIGQRVVRLPKEEPTQLTYEGTFTFDHFLGEEEHHRFPSIKVPQKNTPILMPQIDDVGTTIGVMEPILRTYLIQMCKGVDNIRLLDNVRLPILNRNYSYRPDFCLFWDSKNLYIDIEIDEPYDIVSRNPIHYQGNGDNLRDRYFIRNGWCVIRVTEQQVKENAIGVINYVKRVLRWLAEDESINIQEDTLSSEKRWTYEDAIKMSSNNIREHYLNLPDYVPLNKLQTEQASIELLQDKPFFKSPDVDILPESMFVQNKSKWEAVIADLVHSKFEHCILTRTNGYKWIYTCKSLQVQLINEELCIAGNSPLGINPHFSLDKVEKLEPLEELFSEVNWEKNCKNIGGGFARMNEIIFDAIANGRPLWIAYNSRSTGYSERFLTNLVYDVLPPNYYYAPQTGLSWWKKYEMGSRIFFDAYCSNRKEFRTFAVDDRMEKIRVLNCEHVYWEDDMYAKSFAQLVMYPYESYNCFRFFENAEEILHFMPESEFKSAFVQGNLANLQVMKGELDAAILTYKQRQYDFFIDETSTWGEACILDIKYFIDLCKEHLDDNHFAEGLNAKTILQNFENVLEQLTQSSWMRGNA